MDYHIKKFKIFTPNHWVYRLLNLSLFRISIFTFIFLYLFSHTIDFFYQIGIRGHSFDRHIPENMEWMISEFGDPQGFNISQNPPRNIFKLAWISGSSAEIKLNNKYDYLPSRSARLLETKFFEPVKAYSYIIFSNRLIETLASLNNVKKIKPDALVLTLHPFHSFDSRTVFFRSYMGSTIINELFPNFKNTLIAISVTNPADWLRSFSSYFPLISKQKDLSYFFQKIPLKLSLINSSKPSTWSTRQSLQNQDWLDNFFNFPHIYIENCYAKYSKFLSANFEEYSFTQSMINGDGYYSNILLEQIFSQINEINIPTVVYLAPLSKTASQEIKNKVALRNRRKTLDKIISTNRNPNLDIIAEVPNHIRNSLKYTKDASGAEDYIHLEESSQTNSTELLSDFLAERLHSMIMLKK
jgi:hypothetical protein